MDFFSDAIYREIQKAMASVEEDYRDQILVDAKNSAVLKRVSAFYVDKQKRWTKPQECCVHDCHEPTIDSHTLPRSSALKKISEKNHVMAPTMGVADQHIEVREIGIKKASTFQGFCTKHDSDIFAVYEQHGDLSVESHRDIQGYRSYAREMLRLEQDIEIAREHSKIYNEKLSTLIKNETIKRLPNWAKSYQEATKRFDFGMHNPEMEKVETFATGQSEILDHLRTRFGMDFHNVTSGEKATNCGVNHIFIPLEVRIPIVLSGVATVFYNSGSYTQRLPMICYHIPNDSGGHFCVYYDARDEHLLTSFFNFKNLTNSNKVVRHNATVALLEQVMLIASDHWFMDPKLWDLLSEDDRNFICFELRQNHRFLTDKWNARILRYFLV